ncbi:MAG: rod shape-determining protein MreD [Krumholzibacteria bacterium]|nr:rod shape-determining protein MreD [Candidatus Krumholzibacteria bacterium]
MIGFLRTTVVWVLVAFLGETLVGPWIDIRGISPDFAIIALVLLGLAAGAVPATVGGFVLGLVQDLANPTLLGLNALCKTGLGYLVGRARGRLVYGLPVVEILVLVLAVVAHDLVFLLVQSRLSDDAFLTPLFTRTLPTALYTGVAGVPVIRLAEFFGILGRED